MSAVGNLNHADQKQHSCASFACNGCRKGPVWAPGISPPNSFSSDYHVAVANANRLDLGHLDLPGATQCSCCGPWRPHMPYLPDGVGFATQDAMCQGCNSLPRVDSRTASLLVRKTT